MDDTILTKHPGGKQGVNIARAKYEQVKTAIVEELAEQGPVAFGDLTERVGARLPGFDGSVAWYVTTVKLDLEARGIIERRGKSPQMLVLIDQA